MKKLFILITLVAFSIGGFATSTPTHGTEKDPVLEGQRGVVAAPAVDFDALEQAEGPAIAVEAMEIETPDTKPEVVAPAAVKADKKLSKKELKAKVRKDRKKVKAKFKAEKAKRKKIKRERPGKTKRSHEGGGTIGILAIVFGGLGFILAFVAFPVGLLFAIAAIVLGAIGMGGEKRGLALGGLILGVLTILIPVLLVAVILAALA